MLLQGRIGACLLAIVTTWACVGLAVRIPEHGYGVINQFEFELTKLLFSR